MIATVLDSGPLIAAFDKSDDRHADCAPFLAKLTGRRLLPSPVFTEVCWAFEATPRVERAFVEEVALGTFELVQLTTEDLHRIGELISKYADFPLGAADASVVAVAERRGVARVATLDHRHFRAIKPAHVPALTLLP